MGDAGLTPAVFVAPIPPELTDSTKQIDELLGALAAQGQETSSRHRCT